MNYKESIEQTKQGFEESFRDGAYYNKQTSDDFQTHIRFPRKKGTGLEYEDIISKYSEDVIRGYEVEIIEDEVWITEKVNNLLFRKSKPSGDKVSTENIEVSV